MQDMIGIIKQSFASFLGGLFFVGQPQTLSYEK